MGLLKEIYRRIGFYGVLLFLFPERLKMYLAGKRYAREYPNGSIQYLPEYSSFNLKSLQDKKVILFFIYAPRSLLMYERYFEMLKKLGYEIVVISNSKIGAAFVERFKDECLMMAERYNIGRDFGAYKEFFCALMRENVTPESVIICNDSIFANLRQDDERFVNFMRQNEGTDFVGAAEYFGSPNYHVQSYFLKFSRNVMAGEHFQKFWQKFFISDDRRRNIHKGEVKLSQCIIKDGFVPEVFLATDNIINKIFADEKTLTRFIVEFSNNHHSLVDGYFENYVNLYDEDVTEEQRALRLQLLKISFARLINRNGMIAFTPFLIVDVFGFPFLKRDLVYHDITDWMLIREHAANFDQDLLEEYIADQRIRKRSWNLKGLKERLMYAVGII